MIRTVILVFSLSFAGPLGAQSADGDGEAAGDVPIEEGSVTVGAPGVASGLETGRPEPANPEGIEGLENPDASTFVEGRRNNQALIADRQAPSGYPTLDLPDDDGGALDGASPDNALTQNASDETARAIFTVLAGMNCRIAAQDVAPALGPLGFDPGTVTDILATLYVEGVASLDSRGTLSLPAALCPPDNPAPSPRDAVIAAMRENGCSANEAELRASERVSGLSDAQLLAILGPMRERGEIETGTLTATLSPELCKED